MVVCQEKVVWSVGKPVQNGPACSVGLAFEYNLMFWYAEKKLKERKQWMRLSEGKLN